MGVARLLQWAGEHVPSSSLIVVVSELRAVTTRSVALAGIAALAVYGSVAVGGAQHDLLHGLDEAIVQQWSTAEVWVTPDDNIFDADAFASTAASWPRCAARPVSPRCASIRVGSWTSALAACGCVPCRPGPAAWCSPASFCTATSPMPTACCVRMAGPPSRAATQANIICISATRSRCPRRRAPARFDVAAITTNIGWPSGTITINTNDYSHYWQTDNPTTLAIALTPGVSPASGARLVRRALGDGQALRVQTSRTAHR